MLDNYEQFKNGVIKQIDIVEKIDYKHEYQDNYKLLGEKLEYMAYLRYGLTMSLFPDIDSVLDVGYGLGNFLKVCHEYGLVCYGNEVNDIVLESIPNIKDITNVNCDLVTFFDSLEHFDNIDFVKNIKAKNILISLPWCWNPSDEWFYNWKHRKPNEHIFHFGLESLERFMKESGYDLIWYGNPEDVIRQSESDFPNILTAAFVKGDK